MKKICAYCKICYGETPYDPPPGMDKDAVTHGACPSCYERIMTEMDEKLKSEKGGKIMKTRKDCAYFATCGTKENCARCTGYIPAPAETWVQGREDARRGLPARSANGAYIDGYYNIRR